MINRTLPMLMTFLPGKLRSGPKALIIGGGMVGAETANHLANHGKAVTLVEMLPDIADGNSEI